MQAYIWDDEDNECGYIIYACCAVEARHKVSIHKNIKFKNVRVRRAPWLDTYCGKDIPAKVMLEHGWWVLCQQCQCECALDNDTVVIKDGKAYCIECDVEITVKAEICI